MTGPGPVLCVHPNVELYGSDRMFLATVEALTSAGVRVLAVLPDEGPLASRLRATDCEVSVRRFPVLRKKEVRGHRALWWLLRATVSVVATARWIAGQRPATVYVSTVIAPVWVAAARLAGTRVVVHVHENEPDLGTLASTVLQAPLRAAHLLLANSASTQAWLAAGPSRHVPTSVVYNGVALPVTDDIESPAAWDDAAQRHLVVVGRLSERKGQDLAVAALARLRAHGIDVGLTLIGDSFPGYEDFATGLLGLASELGLQDHVCLLGFRSDADRYMAAADVVLVPSRTEPFGNVAVEALLSGTPCVVTGVDGLLEIVQHLETGLVVPPDDADALADACHLLLTDDDLARSLAESAKVVANDRFSLDQYNHRMREALVRR